MLIALSNEAEEYPRIVLELKGSNRPSKRGYLMQPDGRAWLHRQCGSSARIAGWLGFNGNSRFRVGRALSKGIERGTRLHATEEPHVCRHSQRRSEFSHCNYST
jgi:hypothetical protein